MEIKAGLLILGLIFGVSGCSFLSGTKDLNVRTIRVDRSIPIQPWPKPISMNVVDKSDVIVEEPVLIEQPAPVVEPEKEAAPPVELNVSKGDW